MELIFLGTSSMLPTAERNVASNLLIYNGEHILIDCGEGTQRQLRIAGISPSKISKILISHWHGDHVWGLPGLLQTISSTQRNMPIEIYGPKGTKDFLNNMKKAFSSYSKIEINANEILKETKICDTKSYEIYAKPVKHTTHCLAYFFKEKDRRKINLEYTKKFGLTKHPLLGKLQAGKAITYNGKKLTPEKATMLIPGKKVTFITDTIKSKDLEKFAENSDILVSESTHSDGLKEEAKEKMHLTAKQAAEIAKAAKVKRLVLTHFSQRYKSTRDLEKEAKEIFKNTICAHDFMKITI